MSDSKEFYKVLGLSPGASIDEVKKAYKKKQFDLHPSGLTRRKLKDSAEYKALSEEQKAAKDAKLDEEISKVNEAFTCLSDENKKKEYDTGTGQYSQYPGMDGFSGFADIFSHFSGGRSSRQQQKHKAKNVESDIKITYRDMFLGKKATYRVKRQKICKPCNGKGSKDTVSCSRCGGSGNIQQRFSMGISISTVLAECPDCNGLGYKSKGPVCSDCRGERVVDDFWVVQCVIQPGHQENQAIKFKGQGHEYPGYIPGDVIFNICLTPVCGCDRVNDNFVCSVSIDILTALTGGVIYYDHPDGRKLAVKVSQIQNFETAIVVPNEGFPNSKNNKKGNLYLKPKILVNKGIERSKLSEYLKPLISKPEGVYGNVSSCFGTAPTPQEEEEASRGNEGGFNPSDFFRFF
ncbi:uncharacterized protein LOC143922073 [Arctopsyche grandis]|uniref:uncharacterized protein LOC143922054 n=1 Tax=Arctopsyche grandis TaxID=121162 RepID=UPI00406D8F9D